MESITKNRQSSQMLRAMIERAYGPRHVPTKDGFATELGHGWFNVAYQITLRDGRRVVTKIAPPPHVQVMTYERHMMRNELTALALIQEQTTVPVPPVDYADTSHELVDADWFFMPFIGAQNFGVVEATLSPQQVAAINEQLGTYNRQLNAITGPHFGPLGGPGFPSWRAAFTHMIADSLGDGERAGVDLGWEYDAVRRVVTERAAALDGVTEPRFVEWDLWGSNVMIRDGRIVSIIDHERAFYGDPLIEAGFTALDIPALGDPAAFMRGYGQGPLDEPEAERRRLYSLYLILVMVIETKYRGHQDTQQYDWARTQLDTLMAGFGLSK